MKVKKLLCLGMAVLLMCSNFPQMEIQAQEKAAEEGSADGEGENGTEVSGLDQGTNTTETDYQYEELGDGTLEITKYVGSDTELVIPA